MTTAAESASSVKRKLEVMDTSATESDDKRLKSGEVFDAQLLRVYYGAFLALAYHARRCFTSCLFFKRPSIPGFLDVQVVELQRRYSLSATLREISTFPLQSLTTLAPLVLCATARTW